MKKTLVSIAAASLLALNFTGCGSSSSSSTPETKEVKVADIASVVGAAVKSGALTASELGNGFYNFSSKPSEKMVSTNGFVDYNNNNTQDADEPNALTLSANADKSTLNAFTTLVTESSKNEQEIADLLGLSVTDLNSDTSLASLEVQKRVVLANAIVKQAQGGSSSTTVATTEVTAPVESGTSTDTTVDGTTSTESTSTTTNNAPSSVLPSIDGSSSTVAVTTTADTATTTVVATTTDTATTDTATTDTATTTVAETGDILPSISRSLRADTEDATTPPVLPTVGTATVTASATSDDSGVLPSTETNKYDELLAQISLKVTAGESIYMAVANATGISELANLESATDAESVQSINTTLLAVSTGNTNVIPVVDSTPVDTTSPDTTPVDTTPVQPTPTPTSPDVVVTPTPTPTPTTPTPTATPDPVAEPVDNTTEVVTSNAPLEVTAAGGTDDDFGI